MKCSQCGQEVFLPFRCPYCGEYFCPEHRLPENHNCPRKQLAHTPREETQHEYSVTYIPVAPPKTTPHFSTKEIQHLLIGALLVAGVGLSTAIFTQPRDYAFLASLTIIVTASFFTHEIAHKTIAQRNGLWAEFRLTLIGALLTLLSIASPFFKIIAPGAVMISGYADQKKIGKISIAGPTTNIILSAFFLAIAFILPPTYALTAFLGAAFNAWISLFNLIPIGILDGYKIFTWNKTIWAIAFAASIALTLFTYTYLL
jgi:Zn-dependent protease